MNRVVIGILISVVVLGAIGAGVLLLPGQAPEEVPTAEPGSAQPAVEAPAAPVEAALLQEPPASPMLAQTDVLVQIAINKAIERVQSSPDAAWTWNELARAYHANQFIEEAQTCYEQTLLRDPTKADAAYLLALVLYQQGIQEGAKALAAHAAALDPYSPALWRPGQWLLDEGEFDQAAAMFERAREIDSTDEAPIFGLVRVNVLQGRTQDAILLIESELGETRNVAYREQLRASAYRRGGDPQRAAAITAAAPRGMPVWRDPWLQEIEDLRTGYIGEMSRASRLIDRGLNAEAVEVLERLREYFPEREALLVNLALAEGNLGRRDRAEMLLRSIFEFKPDSQLASENLGSMLLTQAAATNSPPDEAFALLDQAAALDPRATRPLMLRGDYWASRGDADEAMVWYRKALEVDPRHVAAMDKIGVLLAQRQDFEGALEHFERITEIDPKADPIWIRIASLNVILRRPREAQAAVDEAAKRVPRENQQMRALQARIDQLRGGG